MRARHKFNINLNDIGSIDEAIKQLEDYKKELQRKTDMLAKELTDLGIKFAKARVETYDAIFTGELLNEIVANKVSDGIYLIISGSDHSAFVEFGTGQVGEEASYPYEFPDGVTWEYNSGKTIFEISPGQYGWFYPRDGKWYFTQGMPSRPYMRETWEEVYQQVERVAKKVFAE